MKQIKKTDGYEIYKKESGRFAIIDRKTKKPISADAKVKILLEHKLIKLTPAKPKAAPAAETPAAEAAPTA